MSSARYQSVPNPSSGTSSSSNNNNNNNNSSSIMASSAYNGGRYGVAQPRGGYSSRTAQPSPQGGSAGSSSGGSAESMTGLRRATAGEEFEEGGEYGPYSHIKKGSMGRIGQRRGEGGGRGGKWGGGKVAASGAAAATAGMGTSNYGGRNGGPGPAANLFSSSKEDVEADDFLHDPNYKRREDGCVFWSPRGFLNVISVIILVCGLLALFAGYPIISYLTRRHGDKMGGFNLGGTNGTGQVPVISQLLGLQDRDTPSSARTWTSATGTKYNLVFSDEFNEEGRTFWPGDDPFWEAQDLWYGATGDLEWYTPEAVNTTNGALQITMTDIPAHNLNFQSGMVQSWNKFCFQGGYIEFNAVLPGSMQETGYWPGLWLQGNLARAGHLGTTDGMWPYSYNSCDSGILPNQTAPGRPGYDAVSTSADKYSNNIGLNWLSGMRTPACTCAGEDHPGPNVNVGRSAPELDILEAQVHSNVGETSQSLQIAPFDLDYKWNEDLATITDTTQTRFNPYTGGHYQEALSGLSKIQDKSYAKSGNEFTRFGVEFTPDFTGGGKGQVTWYMDGQTTWKVTEASMPPVQAIDIGQRLVPQEPMSIIMNLGISKGFQTIDFSSLVFPATMRIDYVRVYQPSSYSSPKTSCDPPDFPTKDYIDRHMDVYTNPNLTTWPHGLARNRLTDNC